MSKKRQTRRSISIKGLTYQRLKAYCAVTSYSVSGWLEEVIAEKLDAAGVDVPTVLEVSYPKPVVEKPAIAEDAELLTAGAHFTF